MPVCDVTLSKRKYMRILYLSQLLPYPADAGPKVRILHVLQYLQQAAHEVTLVAFSRPGDKPEHLERVAAYCHQVHTVPIHRSRVRDLYYFGVSQTSVKTISHRTRFGFRDVPLDRTAFSER